MSALFFFFFFQAEDGIRDLIVTGVQTCALPILILIGLFLVQSRGTARIGAVVGPVMLVWFAPIGVLGLSQIIRQPSALAAGLPYHAARFFAAHVHRRFLGPGGRFLGVTRRQSPH